MTTRKPAATEQEVRAALEKAETYGVGLLTIGTFAGAVANARGCPDTWPSTERIRGYVPLGSVKAQMQLLADKAEVHPVKGAHWALKGIPGINPNVTYWLPPHRKTELIVRAQNDYRKTVALQAHQFAVKALIDRHKDEYDDHAADYGRLYTTPDYEAQW